MTAYLVYSGEMNKFDFQEFTLEKAFLNEHEAFEFFRSLYGDEESVTVTPYKNRKTGLQVVDAVVEDWLVVTVAKMEEINIQ